jgi:hypothetical protein
MASTGVGGVLGVLLVGAAVSLTQCASLEGLAQTGAGDASGSAAGDGASSGGGGGSTSDGAAGDGGMVISSVDAAAPDGVAPLGPGQIYCASTTTSCDVRKAQCCVTLSGTASAAARSYTMSSALCGPIGGPGCGSYVGTGDDFTMKFPQRCGTAADCASGESCCVLPLTMGDRFAKEIAGISCVPATTCAMTGRALCTGPKDCAATENCLAETDPVLSHLYAKLCR